MISYKMPAEELKKVKDYKSMLVESMFLYALNQRFFKLSRRKDPPYFSCSAAADVIVSPLKACIMTSSCKEKGTLLALESMLLEVCLHFELKLFAFSFLFPLLYSVFMAILNFRLPGYGYMVFQNVKYLLFELY